MSGGTDESTGIDASNQISSAAAEIVSSAKYKVKVTNKDPEGYINEIYIERK